MMRKALPFRPDRAVPAGAIPSPGDARVTPHSTPSIPNSAPAAGSPKPPVDVLTEAQQAFALALGQALADAWSASPVDAILATPPATL